MIPGRVSPTKADSTTKTQGRKSRRCVVLMAKQHSLEPWLGKEKEKVSQFSFQLQANGKVADPHVTGQIVPRLSGALGITF